MQKTSKLISLLSQVEICIVNKYEMCIFACGQSHNIVDIDAWWWVLSVISKATSSQHHHCIKKGKVIFCAIQMNASENILQISLKKTSKSKYFYEIGGQRPPTYQVKSSSV